ncbi:MAG TPA: TMEM14 family protein [Verrucomicrobiae bacterium]|jgi:uncharacterized membrane protein (UPF0136 family)|nr:TMEM14 family protein [Verrucomicrobiae bacterium]
MMQFENTVFWSYVILLLIGGLIGFFSAGSKISLMTSAVAAALLILTRLSGVFQPAFGRAMANVIMALLLVVFAWRLSKTKKFIPSGMMMVLTVAVLALLNFRRNW